MCWREACKLPLLFCDQIHMERALGSSTTCIKQSQHLTSRPATNWPQTHFTSGHIDGCWAAVPFSSPENLNYTPPPHRTTQGRRPHQSLHLQAGLHLAVDWDLKHDAVVKQSKRPCKFYLNFNRDTTLRHRLQPYRASSIVWSLLKHMRVKNVFLNLVVLIKIKLKQVVGWFSFCGLLWIFR